MSKVVVGFTAKYGAEGKVLLERCMEYWIRPMEFVVKTDPTSFEDSVSHRIVNMGTRYVWHGTSWKEIISSDTNIGRYRPFLNSLLASGCQMMR